MAQRIAIYDLDKTLLSRATFTPFLLFAASRRARWRLVLAPVWFAAMVGYKAGLYSRQRLKGFGLRLFLGRISTEELRNVSRDFVARVVPSGIGGGAADQLTQDRDEGRLLVLATAAMEFYAGQIAQAAGFHHVIATRHRISGEYCVIEGGNCYGVTKVARVEALLGHLNLRRSECEIRFYSDSASDAPLLNWADEGVLVNAGSRGRKNAAARGWAAADFR